jgi:glucosamine 6-phosphate synthetase-like amidotransferase/phosphosugar isomerase protein
MCGIYGIAKSPTPYTRRQHKIVRKVLREIAMDSQTRGSHSSGIAKVGASTRIYKSLLPSEKFVDTKEYNDAVKSLYDESYILLGHTRFATDGAIVKSNAHPFRVGDVVGAHNGCVYNIKEMQSKLDKQCPVDSQLIFKSINDNDNIQDAVKDFDSDFALSFVKNNPMVLYLCRETNRPLHVAYIPELKTLFYASESSFINDALIMHNLEADVYSLNKNTLYAFDTSKFDDLKTNVEKTLFKYDSRVYQWTMNKYPTTNRGWGHFKSANQVLDYGWQQELEFDDDASDDWSKQWLNDEALELAEIFQTSPNSWFFDESDDTWYYVCPHTEEVFSEDKMFADKYGTDVWEEVEVKDAS